MTPLTEQITAIHASTAQIVLAVTGGGASAIGQLLSVPGGSRTLLEARVPYSAAALRDWLGTMPEQATSEATARAMAMAAYQRAGLLAGDGAEHVAGVAATAAIATDRPKRGPHRVHVAWQTARATATLSLEFEKGARSREEEERLASQLVVVAAAEAAGVAPAELSPLREGEHVARRRVDAPANWQALLAGQVQFVLPDVLAHRRPHLLLPGSFCPLHEGHLQMARVAEAEQQAPVAFELSIANVDKLPLDFIDMADRQVQFVDRPVVFTRAATFVEKARLFPGATFAIGADTAARIGDVQYYDHSQAERDRAVAEIAKLGCRFLVFGREWDGQFRTLDQLSLPPALAALCQSVPERDFRNDISSTQIRSAAPDPTSPAQK